MTIPRSERQRAAARENGKKGGRPVENSSLHGLQRTMREKVIAHAIAAADFLYRVMRNKRVPIEVRERAAARLFAKGVPDKIEFENVQAKLVEPAIAWRDTSGKLNEVDTVGPEEVAN